VKRSAGLVLQGEIWRGFALRRGDLRFGQDLCRRRICQQQDKPGYKHSQLSSHGIRLYRKPEKTRSNPATFVDLPTRQT
jgi:hypothetical protein